MAKICGHQTITLIFFSDWGRFSTHVWSINLPIICPLIHKNIHEVGYCFGWGQGSVTVGHVIYHLVRGWMPGMYSTNSTSCYYCWQIGIHQDISFDFASASWQPVISGLELTGTTFSRVCVNNKRSSLLVFLKWKSFSLKSFESAGKLRCIHQQ